MRRLALFSASIAALLAFYATRIEPHNVRVRYVPVKLPRLGRAFHRYTIAHISDIHMGAWMTEARLQAVVELINAIRPDLIVITGDFVNRYTDDAATSLVEPLSTLYAPDGKFAVLGNHDYCYTPRRVRAVLDQAGIIELNNRVHTLKRGADTLHLAGVDDVVEYQDRLDAVLEALPAAGAAILLAHEPDFADISAATGRFDLQLSGHSHGGQVRLPLIGAPVLPSFGQRYPAGLYQVGTMQQYTTRGLGMISPFIRFNAPPEISILMLEQP